jgi:hypothetical protein
VQTPVFRSVRSGFNWIPFPRYFLFGSSVLDLLKAGCPPYVAGLVMPVVVDSIKGMLCAGFLSDVYDELTEGEKAKLYSSASIIFPLRMAGVGGALLGAYVTSPSRLEAMGPATACSTVLG